MAPPSNVEVKAGKAKLENKMISSDNRKGLLKFSISAEGLVCVQWREREKTDAEDEFYFAPGELSFVKVKNCPSGRMYYLDFSDSGTKEFYWLQEPNSEQDSKMEENILLVATYQPDEDEGEGDSMQVDATPTPNPTPNTVSSTTPTTNIISTNPTPTTVSSTQGKPTTGGSIPTDFNNMDIFKNIFSSLPKVNKNILLSKILTAENLKPFFRENESIRNELCKYLPEGTDNLEKLFEILHSPQYIQALETLDYAIFEGHGSEISSLLGYEPNLTSMSGVEGFLTAVQEGVNKKKKQNDQKK